MLEGERRRPPPWSTSSRLSVFRKVGMEEPEVIYKRDKVLVGLYKSLILTSLMEAGRPECEEDMREVWLERQCEIST